MNEGMSSQKNQREYLKAMKNNGIIVASIIWITYMSSSAAAAAPAAV